MKRFLTVTAAALAILGFSGSAYAQPQAAGEAIYKGRCAMCHDASDVARAPARESLRARTVEAIVASLSPGGVMAAQGEGLTTAERQAVAAFLTAPASPAPSPTPSAAAPPSFTMPNVDAKPASPPATDPTIGRCTGAPPAFAPTPATTWNGWGNDTSNGRFQAADRAGLNAQTVPQLTLKWAYAFAGATTATSQPAVI